MSYIKEVIEVYKQLHTEELKRDYRNKTDVLKWWYEKKNKYPMLHILAERVLEMTAQSACSERVFSALQKLVTKMRSSIDKDLAGLMVTNYMRTRRAKKASPTLRFPLFAKDFPAEGTTVIFEEDIDNGGLEPDNIDDLLLYRNENVNANGNEDENVDENVDENEDENTNGNEDENEGEAPTHEDAEDEFIEDVIYPDPAPNDARQTRRTRRIDYFMLNRGR